MKFDESIEETMGIIPKDSPAASIYFKDVFHRQFLKVSCDTR